MSDIENTVSDLVSADGRYRVRPDPIWIYVDRVGQSLPEHGWKFHVSSRLADFGDLVTRLVPFLLDEGCGFKLARSTRILGELNNGVAAPPSVGKAVTVYPEPDRLVPLGTKLAELLRGRVGPRVLSDRRVAPDAPVYYRYGPFRGTVAVNEQGNLASVMVTGDGETFEGWATTEYRQPPWATDPFPPRRGDHTPDRRPTVLGTHYEPDRGLAESARGNVYTAVDRRSGEPVVIKQARPYVAESPDGDDARLRLRNERFVLDALRDVPGVARFRDHFRHGEDEYLVTSYDGRYSLAEHVARTGRYRPSTAAVAPDGLDALAHRLADTLRRIHDRGFLVRDLSPKNLVVGDDGETVTFIDFGLCNHHDVSIRGGTRGYAPARQFALQPAEARDDWHALGMTLFAASIAADPVIVGDDLDASRVIALRVLDRVHGSSPPPVIAAVIDLLSQEPETMASAFAALADGRVHRPRTPTRSPWLVEHRRGPDTEELVDRVLTPLVSRVDHTLAESRESDPGVYRGAAGIGLSLLEHLDRPTVADLVTRLAEFSAQTTERVNARPGLYSGSTGVEVFLTRAIAAGTAASPLSSHRLFGDPDAPPADTDVLFGAAGIGLGHILLHEHDPRPEHLAVIRRCAASLADHDPGTAFTAADTSAVPGRDITLGASHGHAGVVEFLRHRHRVDPSPRSQAALASSLAALADRTARLLAASATPTAVPLCTSWCRGLAGTGRVLLGAGRQLGDAALIELAAACARECRRWLPRLVTAGQCCGVAGIGELFCDLIPHDDRFLAAAESAATQLLVLDADAPPEPPQRKLGRPGGLSWASGAAGVLGFLTRLRDLTPTTVALSPF